MPADSSPGTLPPSLPPPVLPRRGRAGVARRAGGGLLPRGGAGALRSGCPVVYKQSSASVGKLPPSAEPGVLVPWFRGRQWGKVLAGLGMLCCRTRGLGRSRMERVLPTWS